MRFITATDGEADTLCRELADRAMDIDADGLLTANLGLWIEKSDRPPDTSPLGVAVALLHQLGSPFRNHMRTEIELAPWVPLDYLKATETALRLLVHGQSLEIGAFDDEPEAANVFVQRLFAWVGSPVVGFTNIAWRADGSGAGFSLLSVPHWCDEGLLLVGPNRVAFLWFFGTD